MRDGVGKTLKSLISPRRAHSRMTLVCRGATNTLQAASPRIKNNLHKVLSSPKVRHMWRVTRKESSLAQNEHSPLLDDLCGHTKPIRRIRGHDSPIFYILNLERCVRTHATNTCDLQFRAPSSGRTGKHNRWSSSSSTSSARCEPDTHARPMPGRVGPPQKFSANLWSGGTRSAAYGPLFKVTVRAPGGVVQEDGESGAGGQAGMNNGETGEKKNLFR